MSSNNIAALRKTVNQLKMEANLERIKVSQAATDLLQYCEQNQNVDYLLIGMPASENPFKEKKSCILL
ncbi:guanine nucleotide-binding protein G(I)/G(S)/G(O) subunit gamma-12-like [Saccoglossus kowalevskii]